jgi:hypothetical protein
MVWQVEVIIAGCKTSGAFTSRKPGCGPALHGTRAKASPEQRFSPRPAAWQCHPGGEWAVLRSLLSQGGGGEGAALRHKDLEQPAAAELALRQSCSGYARTAGRQHARAASTDWPGHTKQTTTNEEGFMSSLALACPPVSAAAAGLHHRMGQRREEVSHSSAAARIKRGSRSSEAAAARRACCSRSSSSTCFGQ